MPVFTRRACLAILFLLSAGFVSADEQNCDSKQISQAVLNQLQSVNSYETDIVVEFEEMAITGKALGKRPAHLHLRQTIKTPEETLDYLVIFDGATQWVEMRRGDSSQTFKLNTAALTKKQRPFDTGYYLNGTGLLTGEDYVGSLTRLLTLYDLKASCSNSNLILSGKINKAAFSNYALKEKTRKAAPNAIEHFVKEFGYLELSVNKEQWVVQGYKLGSGETKLKMRVLFRNTRINKPVNAAVFRYRLPEGKQAVDITNDVLAELKASK